MWTQLLELPISCERLEVNRFRFGVEGKSYDTVHQGESMPKNARLCKIWIGIHSWMRKSPCQITTTIVNYNRCRVQILFKKKIKLKLTV